MVPRRAEKVEATGISPGRGINGERRPDEGATSLPDEERLREAAPPIVGGEQPGAPAGKRLVCIRMVVRVRNQQRSIREDNRIESLLVEVAWQDVGGVRKRAAAIGGARDMDREP
jgi:hypothetical protein